MNLRPASPRFPAAPAAAGYQTITGRAKDTRGNAVASILPGLLLLGVAGRRLASCSGRRPG